MPSIRKRLPFLFSAVVVLVGMAALGFETVAQSAGGNCGLSTPAFCETFDAPQGTGNRSAQLNGILWGVSRTTGNNNPGQGAYDNWQPTTLQACGGTFAGRPDASDILVCNGQAHDSTNDGGTVTALAMYAKQPFDFAGRTGKVTFDVSNDSQGSHSTWPEFWITDQPVPAPFAHENSWFSLPRNGFGIRFAGCSSGTCPGGSTIGVDSAITVANYSENDSFNGGNLQVNTLGAVKASTGPNDGLNHYEIDVSQSQIDIYGTDAGTTAPLIHIASIPANLNFSRGVVWIEDAHYNANKVGNQGTHTFTWDNVGFDGPTLPRDLTFDAPDALTSGGGGLNLGWNEAAAEAKLITINGVTNIGAASGALLTFNFSPTAGSPINFTYVVNGHAHQFPWPYPETNGSSWRTLAVPVPLSDLQAGTNLVSVTGDQPMIVANMDIVLQGAGGAGVPQPTAVPTATLVPAPTFTPVPPTATPPPPATATAIAATATAIALTPTPVTTTCTDDLSRNGTPTVFTRPLSDCANQ